MKRMRLTGGKVDLGPRYQPELTVTEYVSTKKGDAERGPMVRMRAAEARIRLLQNGELAWIAGPRRNELAVLVIDESIPAGKVALRDVAGVTVTESVIVTKPDMDTPAGKRHFG